MGPLTACAGESVRSRVNKRSGQRPESPGPSEGRSCTKVKLHLRFLAHVLLQNKPATFRSTRALFFPPTDAAHKDFFHMGAETVPAGWDVLEMEWVRGGGEGGVLPRRLRP